MQSLSTIRSHLRQVLLASPVCDAQKFAGHLATALRAIWHRYCTGKPPAALTFDSAALPWFEGDDCPVRIDHPVTKNKSGRSFDFSMQGQVVAVDHGGILAASDKHARLHRLGVLTTIVIDPCGNMDPDITVGDRGDIQHYLSHCALGDGQPAVLHACIDPTLSGTLRPLPQEHQAPELRQAAKSLLQLPIPTYQLDSIEGLDRVDWLVLDGCHPVGKILDGARRMLASTLLAQVRVYFQPVFEHQAGFSEVSAALEAVGLRLLRFDSPKYHSYLPSEHSVPYGGSKLQYMDAIFVPDEARIRALDTPQQNRLAFLAHAAYGLQDFAYHVLSLGDEANARRYLAAQSAPPVVPRSTGAPARAGADSVVDERPAPRPAGFSGEIPSVPHMEPQGVEALRARLASSCIFLEYGSGGSSVMAAQTGIRRIYSVDSDQEFLQAVASKIESDQTPKGKYVPIYFDIGPTKAWGYPVDATCADRWPDYVNGPWRILHDKGERPDLILVDGRFRVACLLASLLHAPAGAVILFDDYADRPTYHVVEKFIRPTRLHGRMAEFIVPGVLPRTDVQNALVQYCKDPN